MSTKLCKQSGVPLVGRWPTSVISDSTDGRGLIDSGLQVGRAQPTIWQPHLRTNQPGYKPSTNSSGVGDIHLGARAGDLAMFENALGMFNGRVFKDIIQGRLTFPEYFRRRPLLNASVRQNSRFTVQAVTGTANLAFFTATSACIIKSVKYRCVATDATETAMIGKTATTVAVGSATACLANDGINLAVANDATDTPALHATAANYTLAAGDTLWFIPSAGTDSASGVVTVELEETGYQNSFEANPDWELGGTNAADAGCTFHAGGGVQLATAGAANDQLILVPHQDTNLSAMKAVGWNTAKRLLLETLIQTSSSIASQVWWAGFKLTNPGPWAAGTDDDQLVVWYNSSVDGYLHYTLSVAGTDYTGILYDANSPADELAAAVSTGYHIQVGVDENRYPYIIVNGILCFFDSSHAMTSLTTMIPSIGVQTLTTAAKNIVVRYASLSMDY